MRTKLSYLIKRLRGLPKVCHERVKQTILMNWEEISNSIKGQGHFWTQTKVFYVYSFFLSVCWKLRMLTLTYTNVCLVIFKFIFDRLQIMGVAKTDDFFELTWVCLEFSNFAKSLSCLKFLHNMGISRFCLSSNRIKLVRYLFGRQDF